MAKSKTDLSHVTINQLSALSGSTHRTIKKRLADLEPSKEDGSGVYYDPKIALPLIYKIEDLKQNQKIPDDVLPYEIEKARLTKWQAESQKLKVLKEEGKLIEADEVRAAWGHVLSVIRSSILNLNGRIAVLVQGKDDPQEIAGIIQNVTDEILEKISQGEEQ